MNAASSITVRALKYDGREHRRWGAQILRRDGPLIVLDAEFEEDVTHDLLGSIPRGTRAIEYYWMDRWCNIFRFLDENDKTRLWYCNLSTPASFVDQVLTYIDLDIDVLVQPDLSYSVLDVDDFEENGNRFGYSHETRRMVNEALSELKTSIETQQFPFDLEKVFCV